MIKQFLLDDYSGTTFQLYLTKGVHHKDVPLHTHDFTEFTIITGGRAKHHVEDMAYPICRGSVSAIIPSFSHACSEVEELEHYNLMFNADKLMILEHELRDMGGFQSFFITQPYHRYHKEFIGALELDEKQLQFVETLCEQMLSEYNAKEVGYETVVKSYFFSLIAYISRINAPNTPATFDRFNSIMQTGAYIEEHFAEKIAIEDLARMAFLSVRQYTRVFKQIYGYTPIDYVIHCRLSYACRLIRHGGQSFTSIAADCGFYDKSTFSKVFRNVYKMSPTDYKDKHTPELVTSSISNITE